ncbi:MAG: OsmC family protein [Deltaproteobacteria bacterium]|jgi:putative redox protein
MGVKMSAEYVGELHCVLHHGPSGASFETDAPVDNAGRGEQFSPTDLVGAALLSCALTTMAIWAAKEDIPFGPASGKVEKEIAPGMPRRIGRLTVQITMPTGLNAAQRARLEEIGRTCPVALTLSKDVDLPLEFVYPD